MRWLLLAFVALGLAACDLKPWFDCMNDSGCYAEPTDDAGVDGGADLAAADLASSKSD